MTTGRPALVVHTVAPYWGWLRDLIKAFKYSGDTTLLYAHGAASVTGLVLAAARPPPRP
jgi:hypothetical protein